MIFIGATQNILIPHERLSLLYDHTNVILRVVVLYIHIRRVLLYSNSPSTRSQFLIDRLGRCLKLFVSLVIPSSHKFASEFGLLDKIIAKTESLRKC